MCCKTDAKLITKVPLSIVSGQKNGFSNEYLTLALLNGFWQTETVKYGIHIEPQTQSLGFSAQHKNIGFKYMADDLATNDAHRFSTYLYAQYFW